MVARAGLSKKIAVAIESAAMATMNAATNSNFIVVGASTNGCFAKYSRGRCVAYSANEPSPMIENQFSNRGAVEDAANDTTAGQISKMKTASNGTLNHVAL